MQQGNLNLNWNTNNMFTVYAQDGNIFTLDGQHIGVSIAKYQEVEQGLKKCRDKLVELGVIVPEKTPEEIIKEQSELLKKQSDICNALMNKLEVLENGLKSNQRDSTTVTNTKQRKSTPSGKSSRNDSKSE